MRLLTSLARAYVYAGEWVADCPQACGNVEFLFQGAGAPNSDVSFISDRARHSRNVSFFCSNCKHIADIEWSAREAEIDAVLGVRPNRYNRNWYPAGHVVAVQFRLPHGQTPDELREESQEHGVGG